MFIEVSVFINAHIKTIWETFTDLAGWRRWNTVAIDAWSDSGRLEAGKKFTFTLPAFSVPVRLEPTIDAVTPYERVVWSGSRFGIASDHEFLFKQQGKGVMVTSRETFRGLPLLLGSIVFPVRKVRDLTSTMLADLKKAAEQKDG